MGGLQLPLKLSSTYFLTVSSSDILDDKSVSSFYPSPLSSISSSSCSPAPAKKKRKRKHAILRFIWPFAAVFKIKCSSSITSDNTPGNYKDGNPNEDLDVRDEVMEDGSEKRSSDARRLSLEDLLKMEASEPEDKAMPDWTSCDDGQLRISHDLCHEITASFREEGSKKGVLMLNFAPDSTDTTKTTKADEGALAMANDQHGISDKLTNNVPVEIVVGQPGLGADSDSHVFSVVLRMNLKKFMLVLAALQARSKALKIDVKLLKAAKWKLSGGVSSTVKEELFYQRRIPMGRRCRVQHLEESPYD